MEIIDYFTTGFLMFLAYGCLWSLIGIFNEFKNK